MTKVQAIALCRVSTKQQFDDGNTAPQIERIKTAAEFLDVEIGRWWELAVSSRKGKNIKRKDLLEMQEHCRHNKRVKYLIVDEVDRFMRSIEEYYWWKMEFKRIGVQLILANRPEVDPNDDRAVFDELIDVYRAEQSNNERITKTPEKQKQRIILGYYPGNPPAGYVKGVIKGIPDPDPQRWQILNNNLHEVLAQTYSLRESLTHLNEAGYRTRSFGPRAVGGQKIDMYQYKAMLCDDLYAGVIRFGKCDINNENGLHKAILKPAEHAQLVAIVKGYGKKFTVKRDNPLFTLSNIMECVRCGAIEATDRMLVGYHHNNGKKGNSYHEYDRYRCRACEKSILREQLHDALDEVLDALVLPLAHYRQLKLSLRKAWQQTEAVKADRIRTKVGVIADLKGKKLKMVDSLIMNPGLEDDIKEAIDAIKAKIEEAEQELTDESDFEKDFLEFTEFAIDYVKSWSENWWLLDKEDMKRCKQILFPAGFAVDENRKVCTPEISIVYRYDEGGLSSKKADFSTLEGPVGLEPTTPCLKGRCSNRLSYGPPS